jgi:hypothetical protein
MKIKTRKRSELHDANRSLTTEQPISVGVWWQAQITSLRASDLAKTKAHTNNQIHSESKLIP